MRRIVAGGLALVAAVLPAPPARPPQRVAQEPASGRRQDPRAATLRNFFGRSDCPAAEYADVFLEAAEDYDLDWRLLPSISFIESTGGKAAHNNNLFGWNEGRAEFTTPTAGIHAVGYNLAHSRPYRAKSLDEKLALYNPNAGYGNKVKSVMRSIAPQE